MTERAKDSVATNVRRIFALLFRRRFGNVAWDGVVRLTGLLLLLAIPLTLAVPQSGGVVGFALITMWVNGPISPVLPSTYEPIVMLFGRVYPPLLIAVVGTLGTVYVESLNYHLYRRVMNMSALDRARESPFTRRVVRLSSKAPFLTIWLCSWSIFPYWPVRFLSPLAGYDLRKQLWATFLGRFPRIWFFAALGLWWDVSVTVLALISVGAVMIAITVYLVKRPRRPAPEFTTVEVFEG